MSDIYVVLLRCSKCQDWVRESGVEVLRVEEDMFRRDIVTFNCSDGHEGQRSVRRRIRK